MPVEEVTQALADIRAPISSLLQATKRAEKALTDAMEAFAKEQRKATEQARKPKPVPGGKSCPLFDQGMAAAVPLPSYEIPPSDKLDVSRPFVLNISDDVNVFMQEKSPLRVCLDTFEEGFNKDRAAKAGMRSSALVAKDAQQLPFQLLARVFEHVDTKLLSAEDFKHLAALEPYRAPTIFGIDQGYERISGEGCGFACLRFTLKGTRAVLVTDALQMLGFMKRKGVQGQINMSRMASFMKNMSPQLLVEYGKQCTLWSGTLSIGDLLFVPCGALLGEQVQSVSIGVRVPSLFKPAASSNACRALQWRKQESESSENPQAKQEVKALDVLLSAGAGS